MNTPTMILDFFSTGALRTLGKQVGRIACIALLGLILGPAPAFAQASASEHESHHPAAEAPASVTPSPMNSPNQGSASPMLPPVQKSSSMAGATAGQAGMMEGMQKMMEGMMGGKADANGCCGGGGSKELYPFLMGLPAWTTENRAEVRRLSEERIYEGTILLQEAQQRLSSAVATGNHVAAESALQQSRDGLGRVGSGVAAHKLLQEGQSPQKVALQWFKHEMSLSPIRASEEENAAHGISPFHLITMALLIAFALAMVTMYFFKMRRTAALFGRIEPGAGTPPPGSSPPPTGPAPPTGGPPPTGGTPATGSPPSTGGMPLIGPPTEKTSLPPASASSAGTAMAAPGVSAVSSAGSFPTVVPESNLAPRSNAKWRGLLRVDKIITETPNVKTFRLRPVSGEKTMPFTFTPGQFLNVAFSIGGARMNRSYSISSSPTQREYVDLTIKREPRGAVSRHIVDLLRVGDQFEVNGPVGRFTFDGTEADSIVLISGGVGITPMMSITRYLTALSWPHDIFFVYACRSPADFIFAKDLAALQTANPKLHLIVTMEHPEGTDWQGLQGRLTREMLRQTVPDIVLRRIHICGPPVMMDAVKAILTELKVPSEQVKTEDFGTAAPIPAAAGTTAKSTLPATGPLVTFSKHGKSANIHTNQTVLELSEELGIGIEFSCRVGTCGICKVKMTSGEVEMAVEDALDADDKAAGMILACQAKPKSPIEVEA